MNYLSQDFLKKYETIKPPFTEIGEFVYLRTYSRYIPTLKRREYWNETCKRVAEYNVSLAKIHNPNIEYDVLREEAELLFDNMFNLRTFSSGRTMWVGSTPVVEECKLANFNCAFTVIDSFSDFKELFYLSMVGAGTGFRILKDDVRKLPKVRNKVKLSLLNYKPIDKLNRAEYTSVNITDFEDGDAMAVITVGDSKLGWVESLDFYFKLLTDFTYDKVSEIVINFNNIRPKGEKLKTFGGTASGPESLRKMFEKIHNVIHKSDRKLKSIDVLDIANIIGENVVSGGVRRTAQIALFDSDDFEIMKAKSDIYKYDEKTSSWIVNYDIEHRKMSNNSIFFNSKPTKEELHNIFESIKINGEPGFINAEAARKRRDGFEGVNPCGEILLNSKECCNLSTNNLMAFVKDGSLDKEELFKILRLSTRLGIRMTLPDLEIPTWDETLKEDRLIGVSLTGYQDMVNATGLSLSEQKDLLREMRVCVHNESDRYSKELNINKPLLATTVKPEGTISLLNTTSAGVHYSHSPYYIRRVRINSSDALCKLVEDLEYPIYPEVGQSEENCSTKVIEFPVKAPEGKTKYDVSAIEQLETYKMFMEEWTDHNTSITVHVRPNEWLLVEEWVYQNWNSFVGVSFLELSDYVYPLAPYESMSEDEYNKRKNGLRKVNPKYLSKYEVEEELLDIGNDGCENGICPIR